MIDETIPITAGTDPRNLIRRVESALTRGRQESQVSALLDCVLGKVSEMIEMVWAAAWVFRDKEDAWLIAASLGLTSEAAAIRFRPHTALPCRVGELGTPLLVNDLDSCEFHRSTEEHHRMLSALYAPMKVGARTIGVLATYSDRRDCYAEHDLELLTALGEHIGVTVAFAIMEDRATRIAVLEERDRHARDLHDGVQQVLASLRIYAGEARKALLDRDTHGTAQLLDEGLAAIDDASEELRISIAALRQHTSALTDIYQTGPRMRRRLSAAGVVAELDFEEIALDPAASDALAWICREAITNVLKHSNARHVTLALHREGSDAVLSVRDDGVGFTSRRRADQRAVHIGLQVMRERASQVAGELRVTSGSNGGACVECRLPAAATDVHAAVVH